MIDDHSTIRQQSKYERTTIMIKSTRARLIALSLALLVLALPLASHAESAFTLEYPQNMADIGYAEPLTLDKVPERIVVMTTTPVLTLYEMGVTMISVPSSRVITWPDDLLASATLINTAMSANFDIETVVAMSPDLVMMGYPSAETYGKILDDVGIPVYYLDAGHTVSYESIKLQTEKLIKAFGIDGDAAKAGQAILDRFAAFEEKLEETKAKFTGKTVMVLQSGPPSQYIQTIGGTLGSMADMIGFKNVYENSETSMALIDYEVALDYNPDLVLAVGSSPTGEEHQAIMEADFANNQAYWDSIPAIKNGGIIYLPIQFVSSAGINVIDNINNLISIIEAKLAE
jgi:iron complex transport system substrate-binding protein